MQSIGQLFKLMVTMNTQVYTLYDKNYYLSFLTNLLCSSLPSSVKKLVSISSSGTKSSILATAPLPAVALVTDDVSIKVKQ